MTRFRRSAIIPRGGEALPVGRLAFKAREGRQTALSGFDSHSLPPTLIRCLPERPDNIRSIGLFSYVVSHLVHGRPLEARRIPPGLRGGRAAVLCPHSLRSTLAQFGEQRCQTPEEFKAWSQNLGH